MRKIIFSASILIYWDRLNLCIGNKRDYNIVDGANIKVLFRNYESNKVR